jgi:hypothetical protein
VSISSFACSCIAYECVLRRVGPRKGSGGVGPPSSRWDSLVARCDWSGQGFASVHPRPPPQVRVSY